jgi:hypothetical protein
MQKAIKQSSDLKQRFFSIVWMMDLKHLDREEEAAYIFYTRDKNSAAKNLYRGRFYSA